MYQSLNYVITLTMLNVLHVQMQTGHQDPYSLGAFITQNLHHLRKRETEREKGQRSARAERLLYVSNVFNDIFSKRSNLLLTETQSAT